MKIVQRIRSEREQNDESRMLLFWVEAEKLDKVMEK